MRGKEGHGEAQGCANCVAEANISVLGLVAITLQKTGSGSSKEHDWAESDTADRKKGWGTVKLLAGE